MSLIKKITSNTLFQIIARVFASGSSFLITIVVAKHFGINSYGDFAKISAFVSLFYLFADFGLNAIFLQKEDNKIFFKDLFYTRFFLGVLLIFCVNIVAWFLPFNMVTNVGFSPLVRTGIAIFSFTLITEALTYTALAVFQRELSYEYFMIATMIGSATTLLFVFLSTFLSYSILLVLLSYIFGGIVKAGFSLFFTKENILPMKANTGFIKSMTVETLPITLMLIFNLIYFRIDMILLSSLKSSSDVALYDLSYKFFDFLIALPLFLSNALYPSLLAAEKIKKQGLEVTHRYMIIFAVFAVIIGVPVWIASPLLGLIKPEFLPAQLPLRILLLSLPVFFVTSILQWVLIAKKQQLFLSIVYVLFAGVNIVLNIIFIPSFSFIASAIITGICEAGVFLTLWLKISLSE